MNHRTVKALAATTVAAVVLATLGAVFLFENRGAIVLRVFTAGSLSELFISGSGAMDVSSAFEAEHPGVEVRVLSGGSVDMVWRITGLGQSCDVLAVADYSLIPLMMVNVTPRAADFVIEFAKNSLVIAYTEKSAHHEELAGTNWYDILRRPDVKVGMSNPNDDPCGYRTQMSLVLAELYYDDPWIYDDLVLNNTNFLGVIHDPLGDTYTVLVPSRVEVKDASRLMVRSAEVELMSALESGAIDYLFIYESVAERHAGSGVLYLELPQEINLNDTALKSIYSRVRVTQFADSPNADSASTVEGAPIIYGLTIPLSSEQPELAEEFVAFLLGPKGREIARAAGLELLDPPNAGYWRGMVPPSLRGLVQ